MDENQTKSAALFALIFAVGMIGYILYKPIGTKNNLTQDQTTINSLSSFSINNNPNVNADYACLAAYTSKTDKGEGLKVEKANQKLNEIRTLGTK